MSMYNMVCGNNPLISMYLAILRMNLDAIPRFRDIYVTVEEDKPLIVIYTRTGGNNREAHESYHVLLAQHPMYLRNYDDSADSTFAHFVFRCPEEYQERITLLQKYLDGHPKFRTPKMKLESAVAKMEKKPDPYPPTFSVHDVAPTAAIVNELVTELGLVRNPDV